MNKILTLTERSELLAHHRKERDGRVKDRIKVVLWRDDGWSYESIAKALFLSEEGVRKQLNDYLESKKLKPENGGSKSALNQEQTNELIKHLEEHLYTKASDICNYVKENYAIDYSVRGMTEWLQRNNFTFHQPCGVPAKADAAAQAKFVEEYEKLKKDLADEDHIVFMDGVHPTHSVRFTRGWIKKGERKEIQTNGSQKRLNILGALNLSKMVLHTNKYDTVNGSKIIEFLTSLLAIMPIGVIHVILDQAGYHTCKEVKKWLALNSRVCLHYLPPYSPNLNSIEPCWKIMHEHTTNNIYHASFKDFTEKIEEFLNVIFPKKAQDWTKRLTDNFRIIGTLPAA